jgi:hypothetical protein
LVCLTTVLPRGVAKPSKRCSHHRSRSCLRQRARESERQSSRDGVRAPAYPLNDASRASSVAAVAACFASRRGQASQALRPRHCPVREQSHPRRAPVPTARESYAGAYRRPSGANIRPAPLLADTAGELRNCGGPLDPFRGQLYGQPRLNTVNQPGSSVSGIKGLRGPLRLEAQDTALSRR